MGDDEKLRKQHGVSMMECIVLWETPTHRSNHQGCDDKRVGLCSYTTSADRPLLLLDG